MSAIFVSGATGNIGREVVNQLTSKGIKVTAAVQLEEKAESLKGFGAETVVVDFNDVKGIANGLQGVEKAFSMSPFVPNPGQLGINFVAAAKRAGLNVILKRNSDRIIPYK